MGTQMGTQNEIEAPPRESLDIDVKVSPDRFRILCLKCGQPTQNEYLGYDPWVPRFRASCRNCDSSSEWELDCWNGLHLTPRH